MHDCQKFRDNWIIEPVEERPPCEECRQFCDESLALFDVLEKAPIPDHPEEYWTDFSARLRTKLIEEKASRAFYVFSWKWATAFAAAAIVVFAVTWGAMQFGARSSHIEVVQDHIQGLNPHVVDYLGQSELFLRSFVKLDPSHEEDIEDARKRASRDLVSLAAQRDAAGDFAPVRIVLDEYESVLREIKNLDSPEDLADLQMRIQRNGLIANFKAYQPRVVFVSQR